MFHEECGIFGVAGNREAAHLTYLGLYALQHRGQESAGIVTWDGETAFQHRAMGLASQVFDEETLDRLPGSVALGHVRYSTTGQSRLMNAQPILVRFRGGSLAAAHNGNLVDSERLRARLEARGSIFRTTTDTETILHLIARAHSASGTPGAEDIPGILATALQGVEGAYSILLMIEGRMVAVRDPRGYRPLCFGRLKTGGWVVASESCALDIVDATFEREVEPGEIVLFDDDGIRSRRFAPAEGQTSFCIFEYIYFSRPDSVISGASVEGVRRALGRRLAREESVDADIVISVPDSSNSAALGYSEESGIPLEFGLIRNHYIGRTFIHPKQSLRDLKVRIKYNPVRATLAGRRVVVVDDSIVRGTTSRKLMRMIRDAGASEVHLRVASPPIRFSCFYGIDTATREELIASTSDIPEIAEFIGVDSLAYLSLEGLLKSVPPPRSGYCVACFDGSYPHECIAQRQQCGSNKTMRSESR
ncbi:MAG: amidophosphoribosyltransferase [Candidatus Eisenbacteria bacterium]|nr:amidophosphoribosyltransferase [Candidatus Eisenbacteria bacterium]